MNNQNNSNSTQEESKLLSIEIQNDNLSKINLIYLGKRGGGVKLTEFIVNDLLTNSPNSLGSIHLREDIQCGSWKFDSREKTIEWGNLYSWRSISFYLRRLIFALVRPDDMGFLKNRVNVVILTSPYSFPLELVLKLRGRKLVIIVHDHVRHSGDVWPPNLIIRIRNYLADGLIALSKSVGFHLKSNFPAKKVSIFPHPHFLYPIEKSPLEVAGQTGFVLFVGRIRPYKGLDRLISANFTGSRLNSKTIVIAGEGKLARNLSSNIIPIIRWLDDSEIISLIRNAEVIVFPYMEASQSGLIGTCIALNKKLLVSDVEGLVEQIEDYPNGYIAKDFEPGPLSNLIFTVCTARTSPVKLQNLNQTSFVNAVRDLQL